MLLAASAIAQSEKSMRVEIGYANTRTATKVGSSVPMHGPEIGVFFDFLANDNHFALEIGVNAAFAACDRSATMTSITPTGIGDIELTTYQHYAIKHFWAGIPINVGYNFQMCDSYAIRPYLGLAFNAGFYGQTYEKSRADIPLSLGTQTLESEEKKSGMAAVMTDYTAVALVVRWACCFG